MGSGLGFGFAAVGVQSPVSLHADVGSALVGAEPLGIVLFFKTLGAFPVPAFSHGDSIDWKRQRVKKRLDFGKR